MPAGSSQRSGSWRLQSGAALWSLFGGLALLGGAAAVLWWGWSWVADPQTLPLREVRIVGEFRHLQPDRLQGLVARQVRGGFFSVNVDGIRRTLMQEPWVRDAAVRRIWPPGLQVMVFEQAAVARWGETALLNADGRVFTPPAETLPAGLVWLDGPEGSEAQVLERLRGLQRQLQQLPGAVVRLELSDRRAWSFQLDPGPMVIVGRSDFDARVERFAEVFRLLLAERLAEAEQVDLRYTNGFAVRWRTAGDRHG